MSEQQPTFGQAGGPNGKTPEQQAADLAAELAEFGRRLQDLGERLQNRPERVASTELLGLITEAGQASSTLLDYRTALLALWRLEYPSAPGQ